MTAAKMIVRVSDRQSPMVSPQTHWLSAGNEPDGECCDCGKQNERKRELIPSRRRRRLDRAGHAAACRRLRHAHQQSDQEGEHADDGDDDHRLDEIVALCSKVA